MSPRRCPYCQNRFEPSRYRPDQLVCSREDCQRKRRAAYHRQKVLRDPDYRAQCRDSQKKWRDANPLYDRDHRAARSRPRRPQVDTLARFLDGAKNNVALDLKACKAEVWLVCGNDVKNILVSAHLVLFRADPLPPLGREAQEHPLGDLPDRDI